jgi:hypothetical protein
MARPIVRIFGLRSSSWSNSCKHTFRARPRSSPPEYRVEGQSSIRWGTIGMSSFLDTSSARRMNLAPPRTVWMTAGLRSRSCAIVPRGSLSGPRSAAARRLDRSRAGQPGAALAVEAFSPSRAASTPGTFAARSSLRVASARLRLGALRAGILSTSPRVGPRAGWSQSCTTCSGRRAPYIGPRVCPVAVRPPIGSAPMYRILTSLTCAPPSAADESPLRAA